MIGPLCQCDEAARNRKKRCPDPVTTFPPNEDGEVVCVWCWEVLDAPYMRAKANGVPVVGRCPSDRPDGDAMRGRRVVAGAVGLVLVAGAAYAIPTLILRSRATITPLAALQWDEAVAPLTNDGGVLNDPVSPNPFSESPTRAAYHVGATVFASPAFQAGVLTLSISGGYDGYRTLVRASHADTRAGWKVQGVRLAVPDPAIDVGLKPGTCGLPLDVVGAANKEISFGIRVGELASATTVDVVVDVVPSGVYSAAACNDWDALQ